MNKTELINSLSEKAEITKKTAREYLEVLQEVVFEEMKNEGEVKLFDGVTLYGKTKPAGTARNPISGEIVSTPEKVVPKCKFGITVKNYVSGK